MGEFQLGQKAILSLWGRAGKEGLVMGGSPHFFAVIPAQAGIQWRHCRVFASVQTDTGRLTRKPVRAATGFRPAPE
jgi:hypothetical protein